MHALYNVHEITPNLTKKEKASALKKKNYPPKNVKKGTVGAK